MVSKALAHHVKELYQISGVTMTDLTIVIQYLKPFDHNLIARGNN